MFKFKRSIPVSYEKQGYIYFVGRNYKNLPKDKQQQVKDLCLKTGGEYHAALFELLTTDTTVAKICLKYAVSEATLLRVARRYFIEFAKVL